MIRSYIVQSPLTENKRGAWKNKVADNINSNRPIAGNGISVDYTADGAVISTIIVDENLPMNYVGNYDITREYFPNQIVRVQPNQTYYDITGAPLDMGSTADSGYETFPISPGLFICVNYVPPGYNDETWFDTAITPMYPSGVPISVVKSTRWNTYNVYWPMYPEIPTSATASVTVGSGNYGVVANQNFWNAMPCGMKAMTSCKDNITSTTYVMACDSDAICLPEYYPYQP